MDPHRQLDEPRAAKGGVWQRAHARRHRFLDRYERRRRVERVKGEANPLTRATRVTVGVVLLLTAVAIGWLPGPGFIILAPPGALLIASEWRRAALLMDRVEEETIPRLQRLYARLRGGPKPEWREQDPQAWAAWSERRGSGAADTGQRRRSDDEQQPPRSG